MKKYKNTVQKGSVRYIIFKEASTWYGVALEFNLVEEGSDPEAVLFNLFDAMKGYVKACKISKSRPSMLNQTPDSEYEKLWRDLEESKPISSPFKVHNYGRQIVAA